MPGRLKRLEIIEPEFGHAVESGSPHIVWMGHRMALNEPAEPRDATPDRAVHVVPITRELSK